MSRFKDIGPANSPAGGARQPGFQHAVAVAKAARQQPGEWQDLITGASQGSAHTKVWQIRHRPSAAYKGGGFEARSEQREDDGYAVQIRYVGGER